MATGDLRCGKRGRTVGGCPLGELAQERGRSELKGCSLSLAELGHLLCEPPELREEKSCGRVGEGQREKGSGHRAGPGPPVPSNRFPMPAPSQAWDRQQKIPSLPPGIYSPPAPPSRQISSACCLLASLLPQGHGAELDRLLRATLGGYIHFTHTKLGLRHDTRFGPGNLTLPLWAGLCLFWTHELIPYHLE